MLHAAPAHEQGQQAAAVAKKAKQDEAAERVKAAYAAARSGTAPSSQSASSRAVLVPCQQPVSWAERRSVWQKTGIIGLRGMDLVQLPEDIFIGEAACPSSSGHSDVTGTAVPLSMVRAADMSHNRLERLPPCVASLSGLVSLKLRRNCVRDEGFPWHALTGLSALAAVELDDNQLTQVMRSRLGEGRGRKMMTWLRGLAFLGWVGW